MELGWKKARQAIEVAGERVSTGLVVVAVIAVCAVLLSVIAVGVALRG